MKKFAVLDSSNKVVNVIIAATKAIAEELTSSSCVEVANNKIASIGYTWDETGFIPEKPYESWTLNTGTYLWEAPTSKPNDGNMYEWNEETTSWRQLTRPE